MERWKARHMVFSAKTEHSNRKSCPFAYDAGRALIAVNLSLDVNGWAPDVVSVAKINLMIFIIVPPFNLWNSPRNSIKGIYFFIEALVSRSSLSMGLFSCSIYIGLIGLFDYVFQTDLYSALNTIPLEWIYRIYFIAYGGLIRKN